MEYQDFALAVMHDYLYARLEQMQETKKKKNIEPYFVTKAELFSEIDKDARTVLNKMFQEKKIKVHKTIHAPIQDFVELVKE